MSGVRHALIRSALEGIAGVRLDRILAPLTHGEGVILTFHHVRSQSGMRFGENTGLSITPEFLDEVLRLLRALDYDILPIGALRARLEAPARGKPCAVLTFDDGYVDTRDVALPVLKRHNAPFALFVCSGFAERTAPLWWLDLEDAVLRLDRISLELPDGPFRAQAGSAAEKQAAWSKLYWRLRAQDEHALRTAIDTLAREARIDPLGRVAALCMDWRALRELAREPLVTIGAHSVTHARLARLPVEAARDEMVQSRMRILAELGIDARHFAFPVGDLASAGPREYALASELGFETSLTTLPGVLRRGRADGLSAMPRISVNGHFQKAGYLRTLISGVPFLAQR